MSNLKSNFASKLTSVIVTEKKGTYVYTAGFEDGTSAVIRTSGRKYASVTQLLCLNHWHAAEQVDRTDFLFSAKPTASLGKNEQHRIVATVQIKEGASAPVVYHPSIKPPEPDQFPLC